MYSSKVEICGVNTALLPVLSEQEKTELLLAARDGNAEARQQMIQGNLRLVLSVIQRFSGRGENVDVCVSNLTTCLNREASAFSAFTSNTSQPLERAC